MRRHLIHRQRPTDLGLGYKPTIDFLLKIALFRQGEYGFTQIHCFTDELIACGSNQGIAPGQMADEVIVLNSEELDVFGNRRNGLAEGVDGSVYLGEGLPKRIRGFTSNIDQQMPFVAGMRAVVLDLLADQYPDPLDTLTSFA